MWKTILRRVLIMIPELIVLSILVFLLAKAMPGDPFSGSINPKTRSSSTSPLNGC